MIRALLVDLDNTLIDRDAAVARWLAGIAPADTVPDLVQIDHGGHRARSAFFAAVGAATELPPAEVRRRFAREVPGFVTLKPGASRLLAAFPGPVVVISNGSGPVQRRKIEAAGLAQRVDHVVISGEIGVEKPAPEIFAKALALGGVAARDAHMIGDHPVRDVGGAQAVGISATLLRTPWFAPPPGVQVVDRIDEVCW